MPQYCDLQVNGAFGVDFNSDDLSAEQLHFAAQSLAHLGVVQFLPTLITDSLPKLELRLKRLILARASSTLCQQMIPGFHVEGPFLSEVRGYVGAHPVEHTCDASIDAAHASSKLERDSSSSSRLPLNGTRKAKRLDGWSIDPFESRRGIPMHRSTN